MNRKLKKSSFWDSNWPAFLLPAVGYLIVMIVSGHTPFGSSSILYSDMYHQYYPFFVEFRRVLRSGGSLQYNWSVGMGFDYLSMISYYLASPLNLLSVLVPEKWLLGYFSLMVPVKLGLAGLFFSIMLRKLFGGQGRYASLFSAFYGLCAWALGYQWNLMWLDTFALLPLVVLGEIYLLRDRKFLLYAGTLFLAVLVNYYIGFFVCIFVAMVFFCYEICRWQGWKRFWGDLGRILLFSVLALAMTAFLEIPAYLGLQNTYSSVNKFPTKFDLNIASEDTFLGLLGGLRQVFGNLGGQEPTFKEGLPNLYCGVLTGILAIQFLTTKKIRIREKILSVLLLLFFALSFLIRQLDYIWHGFHFTNMIPYRFSFLFSFVMLVMAYRAFLSMERVKPWQILLSTVLFVGICALSDKRLTLLYIAYNLGFAVIYAVLLLLRREAPQSDIPALPELEAVLLTEQAAAQRSRRIWSAGLACVMAAEMACALANFGMGFGGTMVTNYPKGKDDTVSLIRTMKDRETDLFYRTEFTSSQTLNDGALNGIHGISIFSSAANVNMTKFGAALGMGAKPSYNRYLYEETSPVANAFLNLKYQINRDGTPLESRYWATRDQSGNITLQENSAYLPLGFMTTGFITELKPDAPTAGNLSFQNELFAAATGIQAPVYDLVQDLHVSSNGIDITSSGGYCSYSNAAATDTVTYSFIVPSDGFVCFAINGSKKDSFTIYKNNVEVKRETIGLPQIFAAGDFSAGDLCQVTFELKDGDSGTFDLTAGVLNDQIFQQGLELLRRSALELTSWSDTKITGNVTATADGVLYTSIPYDSNWLAYVDGEKVEITPICDALVGVSLSRGSHTVEFRYDNAGYRLGLKISLSALFLLISCYLVQYRPWDKKAAKAV